MKTDDEYLCELQSLIDRIGRRVCINIMRWPKYSDLKRWIIEKTPQLNSINALLSTRIYWILNGLTDFPKCQTCGKPITTNASLFDGYTVQHCSNSCAQRDPAIKEHKKQTCMTRYGVEFAWQADIVKQHIEDSLVNHYGVKHALASAEVQQKYQSTNLRLYGVAQHIAADSVIEKTKKTNIRNYGVDNPWKLKEIQDKCRQRYCFEGHTFDSSPEIAFFIWLRDNGIDFKYQPDVFFEYIVNGKTFKYYPDFDIGGRLYEIKGDHFFEDSDPTKKMINPFDSSQNDKYEAKHQCMMQNNVTILTEKDYCTYIEYVEDAYGKDFLKKFKHTSSSD